MNATAFFHHESAPSPRKNARPMPKFGYEELKGLVDQALASAPR